MKLYQKQSLMEKRNLKLEEYDEISLKYFKSDDILFEVRK